MAITSRLGRFQSTPPGGRRRISVPCHLSRFPVSIHASGGEATAVMASAPDGR